MVTYRPDLMSKSGQEMGVPTTHKFSGFYHIIGSLSHKSKYFWVCYFDLFFTFISRKTFQEYTGLKCHKISMILIYLSTGPKNL